MAPGVFCHYMVGGMNTTQASIDVSQAQAMGFDAFALNIISTDSWSNEAVGYLFAAAATIGFHLFFSFDMTHFTDPSQFFYLLDQYTSSVAYYNFNSLPFVSTFYGGNLNFGESSPNAGWQDKFKDAYGKPVYFAPSFSDSSTAPANMYSTYPVADALFSWDSAWPQIADGKVNVSSTIDQAYQSAAVAANKQFVMRIAMSTEQFKHLDTSNNWYRRGELNIATRMPQVLALKPAFLEYQTWNDGPESHYIGNVWDFAIEGSPSHAYIDGFDHTGFQNIITPFISAFKAGKSSVSDVVPLNGEQAVGTFWYRTILTTATCASDALGKPDGWQNAEDLINVAILLSSSAAGSTVNVYSGGVKVGTQPGKVGLNYWGFTGMKTGEVKVEVLTSAGSTILSETGGKQVSADAAVCNYNYYVVGLK